MKKVILVLALALGGCATSGGGSLRAADYDCLRSAVERLPAPQSPSEVEPVARTALGQCNATRDAVVADINSVSSRMIFDDVQRRAHVDGYDTRRYHEAMELAGSRLEN